MSEITQDLITKELVICDAFGELRLKPILFEKNVEYGTNKIIDLLNDLQQENQQLKSILNEVKEYVKNELKNFERLINTSPIPSFYQLPYGVCVSILNKIEKGD